MGHEKHRKPIDQRIRIQYQDQSLRIRDIAGKDPLFLIKMLESTSLAPAIVGELNRVGWPWDRVVREVEQHPEWEIDLGIISQSF